MMAGWRAMTCSDLVDWMAAIIGYSRSLGESVNLDGGPDLLAIRASDNGDDP